MFALIPYSKLVTLHHSDQHIPRNDLHRRIPSRDD